VDERDAAARSHRRRGGLEFEQLRQAEAQAEQAGRAQAEKGAAAGAGAEGGSRGHDGAPPSREIPPPPPSSFVDLDLQMQRSFIRQAKPGVTPGPAHRDDPEVQGDGETNNQPPAQDWKRQRDETTEPATQDGAQDESNYSAPNRP